MIQKIFKIAGMWRPGRRYSPAELLHYEEGIQRKCSTAPLDRSGEFRHQPCVNQFQGRHEDCPETEQNGTVSDIANFSFSGNAMAKVPVGWLKQFENNYFEYCYISNGQVDKGYRAYAHTRADGSVMDNKWLRIFNGSILDGKLRSLSGQQPTHDNQTPAEISAANVSL